MVHWVRTLQIPKSQSAAWPSQHKYPSSRWLNLSAPGTGFNMDKGWCYVSNSRCTKKFQRMVSSFTCATFNNTTPLVSFEMHKLHNIRAYEAVHLLTGEGENPEHTQLPLLLHRWLARLTPSRPEMVTMIMAMICLGISQGLLRWTLMVTTVRKHRL
ncbi:PREDICTED: uncharacterized protein LOC106332432 isoform X2 [Brassica oleracea var. oleracea]|uniref:uncharacterized protein LOC106332432 isoform X2 n=1 Tax=Brassica oleracea var. oleracea TaxID=109376 RepID=UPI0006A72F3E|nr:PREDICTED: uncharacterized protein LOC106332432 isoform X2 [Brassica oleracea var. oleracea]